MSNDDTKKSKRVYRNVDFHQLKNYHLPAPGKVSILHRVSGALLFLSLPVVLIPLFQATVASEQSFTELGEGVGGFILKLIILALIWAFMHHLCAGIRFLLLDLHLGIEKEKAKTTARVVLGVSLVLTAIFAIKMFGVL